MNGFIYFVENVDKVDGRKTEHVFCATCQKAAVEVSMLLHEK